MEIKVIIKQAKTTDQAIFETGTSMRNIKMGYITVERITYRCDIWKNSPSDIVFFSEINIYDLQTTR